MPGKLKYLSIILSFLLLVSLFITFSNTHTPKVTTLNFKKNLEKCKTVPKAGAQGYSITESLAIQKCFLGNLKAIPTPKEQLEMLVKYSSDPYFEGMCHSLAHELGTYDFKKFKNLKILLSLPNISFCENGYIHGSVDEMGNEIEYSKLLNEAASYCTPLQGDALSYIGCIHGLGHGSYEAAKKNLFLASKICDTLSTPYVILQCKQGDMMAYGKDTYLNIKGQIPDAQPLAILCSQPELVAHDLQRPCLQVGLTKGKTPQIQKALRAYCNTLLATLENDCWYGIVESYLPFNIRDINPKEICQANNSLSQSVCIHHLTQEIGAFLGIEAGQAYCDKLTPKDRPACKEVTPFEMKITETDSYLNDNYAN